MSESAQTHTANRSSIWRRIIGYVAIVILLTCTSSLLRTSSWRGGTEQHTIMEVAAAGFALTAGILALIRFYAKKSNIFLFIGAGFLGTSLLDGYHAAVTSYFFNYLLPSPISSLIPWSWTASRLFLSVMMCLSYWAWAREEKLGLRGRIGEISVFVGIGVLAFGSFAFFGFVPLPPAYSEGFVFGRPQEFVPALFFLVAFTVYFKKEVWKLSNFEHWIVLSLLIGFLSQVAFMSFSYRLFDAMFDAAHLLKNLSYVCVLIGLLVSMYDLFTKAEESALYIARANEALREEVAARKRAERELRDVNETLEKRVKERSAALERKASELIRSNEELKKEMTERISAEEAYRASVMRFESVVESAGDGIVIASGEGLIVSCNRSADDIFGYERGELVGKPLTILMPERYREAHQEGLKRFRLTGKGQVIGRVVELRGLRKNGEEFPLELSIASWRTQQNVLVSGIVRDVTTRKAAEDDLKRATDEIARQRDKVLATLVELRNSHEELKAVQMQLIQAAKMESVGCLAAGVAHEVKNPLAVIQMGIDYLEQNDNGSSDPRPVLADMERAVGRANTIIRGLLNFSAPKQLEIKEEDLNGVVQDALLLVKHELEKNKIRWTKDLGGTLPRIPIDRTKIEQVFVNVFMNAIQAMEEGGTLHVKTSLKRLTGVGDYVGRRHTDRFRVGEEVVMVKIQDTGTGIPETEIDKVFDPFFTTKRDDKGTGLGLAVTRKIVDLHKGNIEIRNREEGGAEITIVLKTKGAD